MNPIPPPNLVPMQVALILATMPPPTDEEECPKDCPCLCHDEDDSDNEATSDTWVSLICTIILFLLLTWGIWFVITALTRDSSEPLPLFPWD